MSWTWVPRGRSNVGFYGDGVPIFSPEPVPVAALRLFSAAPGVALRKPLILHTDGRYKSELLTFLF